MHFQLQHALLVAMGLIPSAIAQTSSACDPLKGCRPHDPALGTTYSFDFTKGGPSDHFTVLGSRDNIHYDGQGIHLPTIKNMDSPSIGSNFFIFFGKVEILMKAAPGHGIVSSMVFQSDCLDEIDLEFVGSQTTQFQTNLFSKGNQETTFGGNSSVANPASTFYTYTVDWTTEAVTWSLNGQVVRTVTAAQAGDSYPQTPMQIKIGSWSAGDASASPGRIAWSEGPIDYSQGPFDMIVKSVTITDYSAGATEYTFADSSCSAASVKVSKDAIVSSSSSASASKTSTSSIKESKTSTATSTKESKTSSASSTSTAAHTTIPDKGETTTSSSHATITSASKTTLATSVAAGSQTAAGTGTAAPPSKTGAGSSFRSLTVAGSVFVAGLAAVFVL